MKLFYRSYGEGDALMLLHGMYGSSDNWNSLAKYWSAYMNVIAVDLRNHGNSPHTQTHTYHDMCDDLLELMIDLSIEKTSFLGHSMGGKTAMTFALKHPTKVNKLIIADVSPRSYNDMLQLSPEMIPHNELITKLLKIDFPLLNNRAQVETEIRKFLPSEKSVQFFMKNVKREKDDTFSWKFNIQAISNSINDLFTSLHETVPFPINGYQNIQALFLKGDHSDYIRAEDEKIIRYFFPKSEIKTVCNACHWVHADNPDFVRDAVQTFLLEPK